MLSTSADPDAEGPELPKELFGNETFSAKTRLDFTAEDDLPPELVPAEIDELLAAEEGTASLACQRTLSYSDTQILRRRTNSKMTL